MATKHLPITLVAAFVLTAVLAGADRTRAADVPPDSLRTPESYVGNHRFLRTSAEIVALNVGMSLYGEYFIDRDDSGFHLSMDSFVSNPRAGFEWDNNVFFVNNLRHPYQGAQYYGAGRANGYDFYQSSAFAFIGSWLFEYTGESKPASYNDWLNTAIGGISRGEALFRASGAVLDNESTGFMRLCREVGGLVILPARGFNRVITGESFQVHANPERRPGAGISTEIDVGARVPGDEPFDDAAAARNFFAIELREGIPGRTRVERPFDVFTAGLDLSVGYKPRSLRRLEVDGMLAGSDPGGKATIGAVLLFDYFDDAACQFGAQSIGAGLFSGVGREAGFELRASLVGAAVILGSVRSDYFDLTGRWFDHGPGASYGAGIRLLHGSRALIELDHSGFWIHAMNGNAADHFVARTRARAGLPLVGGLGAGVEYILYSSTRTYEVYPDVSAHRSEWRVFVAAGR